MMPFLESVLTVAVRRAASFVGGGAALTDTDVGKIVGALLIVGDLLWQAYKHHQQQQADTMRRSARP